MCALFPCRDPCQARDFPVLCSMGSWRVWAIEARRAETGSKRAIATAVDGTVLAGRTTPSGGIGGDAAAVILRGIGSPLGSKYNIAHAASPMSASQIAGPFGGMSHPAR